MSKSENHTKDKKVKTPESLNIEEEVGLEESSIVTPEENNKESDTKSDSPKELDNDLPESEKIENDFLFTNLSDKFFTDEEKKKIFKSNNFLLKPLLYTLFIVVIIGLTILFFTNTAISTNFLNISQVSNFFSNKLHSPISQNQIASLNLDLESPDDETIVYSKNLKIYGQSLPEVTVMIINNNQYIPFQADNLGKIDKTIALDKGLNELSVTVFDNKGNSKSETRTVYYSEEKI